MTAFIICYALGGIYIIGVCVIDQEIEAKCIKIVNRGIISTLLLPFFGMFGFVVFIFSFLLKTITMIISNLKKLI